jgi:chromate transporter
MNDSQSSLLTLTWYFAGLSLVAIGGANGVLPEMHRHFVEASALMTETHFVQLVALAQAAPGPNVLVVALIGWQLAGLGGALTCFVAMCVPSSLLSIATARILQRFQHHPWQRRILRSLAPIAVGVILAAAFVLMRAADHDWVSYAITAGTAACALYLRLNPLLWLAVAGAITALWR